MEDISCYIFSTFYWSITHIQKSAQMLSYNLINFHKWTYHWHQHQDREVKYYQDFRSSTYAFFLYLSNPPTRVTIILTSKTIDQSCLFLNLYKWNSTVCTLLYFVSFIHHDLYGFLSTLFLLDIICSHNLLAFG